MRSNSRFAEARDLFKYDRREGGFTGWVEAEFEMSDWTARSFMQVSNLYGTKSEIISDFPPTVLYALAAPSTPDDVRDRVEQLLIDGQRVTAADVRRMREEALAATVSAGGGHRSAIIG